MNEQTLKRIPAHLKQFVVQQDYENYNEIDQSVWRFVLLQTYHQLKDTAHHAYVNGLRQTGINRERIPRIEEMDSCLSNFGWGAVCVDGFIPPRAFQEFQSLGIMTIAADIRTPDHLAYTPAPDIIHESAGHSPIIPDEKYRLFLKRFGEIGCRAFSSPEDLEVYESIRHLSIVKESPESSQLDIQNAQLRLDTAIKNVTWASETALLSRLHWWTVEYGLVGTPQDYSIYGAGLLSSVGESFFCHSPKVRKIPLNADCIHMSYDITKPQPQLFVVEDFDHLNQVLEDVANTLAVRQGGIYALEMAAKSGEAGTVELDTGIQVTGCLAEIIKEQNAAVYLKFAGPTAISIENQNLPGHSRERHAEGFGCPVGEIEGLPDLSHMTPSEFFQQTGTGLGKRYVFNYKNGVKVDGILNQTMCSKEGYLRLINLIDCRVTRGEILLFDPCWGEYDLVLGKTVQTAYAGSADPSYWPETEFRKQGVPKKVSEEDLDTLCLQDMYQRVYQTRGSLDSEQALDVYTRIHGELDSRFPEHWLLRWNMLEDLTRFDSDIQLASRLKEELLDIEKRHFEDVPISMGLKYLGLL